uniref:C2H2-type domain-containing protein n=1 Tax=Anopheles epiroticus TaxID=199890 RepID=A0A182PNR8_9DIPT
MQAMVEADILNPFPEQPLSVSAAGQCASKRSHRYQCEFCQQTFKRRDEHDRHRFTHTGVYIYPCLEPGCGKAYSNRSHLLRHVRANHLERTGDNGPTINCQHPNCAMKFATKQAMKRHYQTKHVLGKPYACDVCSERFWRKLQLKLHKVRHTGEYPHRCEHCGQGFVNLKSMRSHRCKHHAQKCADCAQEFLRWSELVAHRRLEHPTQYRCEQCEKLFNTKRNLNLHGRVHEKQRAKEEGKEVMVYECPYAGCPRFYEHERNLTAHVRSKHESRKRVEHVCPVAECGKVLATKKELEQHRKLHLRASKAARTEQPEDKPTEVPDAGEGSIAQLDVTTDSEVEGGYMQELLEHHMQHLCTQLDTLQSNLVTI